jgi:parvulin-like peptidyl-prolyl isomerase
MHRLLPLVVSALFLCLGALPSALAGTDAPTEWSARHILVAYQGAKSAQATRSKAEAKELAEKALAEIRAGGAFEKVSHTYSDDKTSDAQGGFLGIFSKGMMTPAFQTAVEGLKDGEVSGVVESPFGWHVIQRISLADAVKIMEATTASFVAAIFSYKGSRDPQAVRAKDLAQQDAVKAMTLLRKGATFESLPPELGATPMKPGWTAFTLRKGMIRPEFKAIEETVFALAVGQVSDPFDTPAGWMVIVRKPWFRMHVQHLIVMYAGNQASPPSVTRTKVQARARAEEALKKLEADPTAWATIVAEYSDEPGAGERLGDLPTIEPGSGMVPEFEIAVSTIPSGGHSQVFESQFGFHVVRRVD